ncbi:interleukin 12Ba [Cyprinodon tularosa]|uniref:interleukin 12Ba n=1 Tax=Cyprinodon tularosa TaxID=77115 RepID=UPI0018E25040|nr:interleukin 12Ba [Cyprinodon tularosa]
MGLSNKMKLFVFNILCVFLQGCCPNPLSYWTLEPNVLVLEVNGTLGQQPITCLEMTGNNSQDIFWRKNGIKELQKGNVYLVQLLESFGGGNYTCHSQDGSLLNHTEVLIQHYLSNRRILLKNQQEDYLSCSTQNYNGEFHCSWTWHSNRVGKAAFIKAERISDDQYSNCSADPNGHQWTCSSAQSNFSCHVDNSGSGVFCLDQQHCPYVEERQQIRVTVFVKTNDFLLESYSKLFYLSEIVKPDKVKISKVNKTVIEWSYPSSWNTPYSYFPLTFQISQLRGRCRGCENPCADIKPSKAWTMYSTDIYQLKVKHRVKAVCVRAKDAFCNSEWSEWTHIRLRRGGKNSKQQLLT